MESQLVKEYNAQAGKYGDYAANLPFAQMETELFRSALGSCSGSTVLDLGGGGGLKAREAIDAGAASVDVVDISPEMMRSGQDIEKSIGRDAINWYEGDVTKSLEHLPLRPSYDIVMVNWTFDHAHNLEEYEGMWRNVGTYLKPGGQFVGVRVGDLRAPSWDGRYGNMAKDLQITPDGIHYRYVLLLDDPLEFEASSTNSSLSGATDVPEKYGITEIMNLPPEETAVAKKDPELWKTFLDKPGMVVFKGKKRLNA